MDDANSLTAISIVVPAYNEEDAIGATIGQIRHALASRPPESWEIIVVDDGSADRTAAMAAAAGARVIRHPHNIGYGRSLKDGILEARYDTIVIIDGDGTYPAEEIPRLVARAAEGFDMVVGARTGVHYAGRGLKTPLRRVLTFLVEFTSGRPVPDVNSGLRVFSRATVISYFGQLCDTFSFTTSLTLAYMMTGRFVTYLPIAYAARTGSTKVRLFRDSLRTMQYIVQAILYYNPIKIFLLLAATAAGVSIGGVVITAAAGPRLSVELLTLGALAAIVVFGLGLLADLLRQILTK